jgi:AbrB family looped-hinge helix DNA binding protein
MAEPPSSAITSKGQVTIPRQLRQQLGLRRGSRVCFVLVGDHIEVRPARYADRSAKGLWAAQNHSQTCSRRFRPGLCAAAVIGLDTNILARYFVEEADADAVTVAQREAAQRLIESGDALFVPTTVVLELESVLRGYYRFSRQQMEQVITVLLEMPNVNLEDHVEIEQVLAGQRDGLDYADALHLASCRNCTALASFNQRSLAGPARQLNLQPRVIIST